VGNDEAINDGLSVRLSLLTKRVSISFRSTFSVCSSARTDTSVRAVQPNHEAIWPEQLSWYFDEAEADIERELEVRAQNSSLTYTRADSREKHIPAFRFTLGPVNSQSRQAKQAGASQA
jgi:hypothetical protein